MKTRISQKEIARLANVCQSTVSAVLNPANRGNTKVGAETRELILRIAAEHNYRPNLQSRQLRGDTTSNLVGVLINPQISQFFYDLLLPLERELHNIHKRMLIGLIDNDVKESEATLGNFVDYNLDGVIVLHHDIVDAERLFSEYASVLPQIVYLDPPRGSQEARFVQVDYASGVIEAVKHCVAGGRKRIALCMNDVYNPAMRRRLEGYRIGLLETGIPFDENLLLVRAPASPVEFESLISDAVDQLCVREHADAIIAGNDEWALAILKELHRRDIAVPGDVALIGYGNTLNICRSTMPELASIDHRVGELARKLVETLRTPEFFPDPVQTKLVMRNSADLNSTKTL